MFVGCIIGSTSIAQTSAQRNLLILDRLVEEIGLDDTQKTTLLLLLQERSQQLDSISNQNITDRKKRTHFGEVNDVFRERLPEVFNEEQLDIYWSMRRSKEEQIGEEDSTLDELWSDF